MRCPDDSTLYAVADFGENCVFGAESFVGILDTADALAFNAATATTHTLNYALGPDLANGDTGTVGGIRFNVVGTPTQISTTDRQAHLVRIA